MKRIAIAIALAAASLIAYDRHVQAESTQSLIDNYSDFTKGLVVEDSDVTSEILGLNMSAEDADCLEEFIQKTPRTTGTVDGIRANGLSLCYGNVLRGSGFLLGPEGYFISARHVFDEDPTRIPDRALSRLGERFDIEQTVMCGSYDLIIGKLRTDSPIRCKELALSFDYSTQDTIFMLPSHHHSAPDIAKGKILYIGPTLPPVGNALLDTGEDSRLTTTLWIEKGHSGSPVLDKHGNILGVVTWGVWDLNGDSIMNYSLSSALIRDLVQAGTHIVKYDSKTDHKILMEKKF